MKLEEKELLMELKDNERIDDLELNNLKIIQNKNYFCFGIDSVLLSDFAKEIHRKSEILDLGAGNRNFRTFTISQNRRFKNNWNRSTRSYFRTCK